MESIIEQARKLKIGQTLTCNGLSIRRCSPAHYILKDQRSEITRWTTQSDAMDSIRHFYTTGSLPSMSKIGGF